LKGTTNRLTHINATLSITSLTVDHCSLEQLRQISKYMPLLNYLNIQVLVESNPTYDEPCFINCAVYLKQLIIGQFEHAFEKLEIFLKHTKLKILTIERYGLMNAYRREHLTRSS
jgi:hypothetical protein